MANRVYTNGERLETDDEYWQKRSMCHKTHESVETNVSLAYHAK
jgi:hypothetical protein